MLNKRGDFEFKTISIAVLLVFFAVIFTVFPYEKLGIGTGIGSPRYNSWVAANEMKYLSNDLDLLYKTSLVIPKSDEIYYVYSTKLNERYYADFSKDSITTYYDPEGDKSTRELIKNENIEIEGGFKKDESYIISKLGPKIHIGAREEGRDISSKISCLDIEYNLLNTNIVLDPIYDTDNNNLFSRYMGSTLTDATIITSQDNKDSYLSNDPIYIGVNVIQGDNKVTCYYKDDVSNMLCCQIANALVENIATINSLDMQSVGTLSKSDSKYYLTQTDNPGIYLEIGGLDDDGFLLAPKYISSTINKFIMDQSITHQATPISNAKDNLDTIAYGI